MYILCAGISEPPPASWCAWSSTARCRQPAFACYPARIACQRALGFTRARVTKIMDLLLLPADIQEKILCLEVAPGAQVISERALRGHVLKTLDWAEQQRRWTTLRPS